MKDENGRELFTCPCCGNKTIKFDYRSPYEITFKEKVGHTEIKPVPGRKIQFTEQYLTFTANVCEKCYKAHTNYENAGNRFYKYGWLVGFLVLGFSLFHNYKIGALQEHPIDTITGGIIIFFLVVAGYMALVLAVSTINKKNPHTTYEHAKECGAISKWSKNQ